LNDPIWAPLPGANPTTLASRAIERCRALAGFSESATGTTRTFLSPPMHQVHRALRVCMTALNMEVSVDAVGNLHGLHRSISPAPAGRLLIASHLDTVPNAGAYDGILGVMLGLALVEALQDRRLPYEIEVIGFSEEEGVRFGVPFLGSRALVGSLSADLLELADGQGVTVADAITHFGLDPAAIAAASYANLTQRPRGYLEFHIEQGPVLESLNLPLAVVEAIAGQSRFHIAFHGQANHAGTTPMTLRRDALACAAEWVTEVERLGRSTPGLVATVGRLQVNPGAGNVVPGRVDASLDIRHAKDHFRHTAAEQLLGAARSLADARAIQVTIESLLDQPAVPCDPHLGQLLNKAIAATGQPPHAMVSGAGHDAMIVAPHFPTAILFLRSPGGISHHPSESVLLPDVSAAIEAGLYFLDELEKDTKKEL
jgi:allantoate deiminase